MSKEKQIEEMAKLACTVFDGSCYNCPFKIRPPCPPKASAERLYNAGYRKQSEVIEEYRKKVYSKMEKYTVFGREYIQRIMREVENEMKGV